MLDERGQSVPQILNSIEREKQWLAVMTFENVLNGLTTTDVFQIFKLKVHK